MNDLDFDVYVKPKPTKVIPGYWVTKEQYNQLKQENERLKEALKKIVDHRNEVDKLYLYADNAKQLLEPK